MNSKRLPRDENLAQSGSDGWPSDRNAYLSRLAGILTGFARERGGPMEAHVLGSRIRTSCTTAAFANALLINALDYDDIDLGHMGATAISAAFASGEKTNAAGKDLIAATVVGYEVSARIGRALLPTSPRKKTHGWGTWQTFGTAAASTCLLKLEPDRAVHALAIAGANAPVPSVMKTVYGSCGPNMVKNNFGTAAEVGLTAALLSARGFEGPMDLFEGDTGFWRMIGTDRSDLDAMVEGLGREYEILKVGFKQFPACRVIQSTIETALACVKRHRIDVSSIDRIRVRAVPRACNGPFSNPRPKDMWAAQFSTPYSVAVALRG